MEKQLRSYLEDYPDIDGIWGFMKDPRVEKFLNKYSPTPNFFALEIGHLKLIKKHPMGVDALQLRGGDSLYKLKRIIQDLINYIEGEIEYDGVRISSLIFTLKDTFNTLFRGERLEEAFNSEKYYKNRIEKLNQDKLDLAKKVEALTDAKKNTEHNQRELEKVKRELEQTQVLINRYKLAEVEREKQDDEKKEWENKIKTSFETLKKSLDPLNQEKERLRTAYELYRQATTCVFLALALLEFILFCYVFSRDFPTHWTNLLPYSFPVPVLGALLWGFITQINRIQRQLTVLARHIHEIEYIEGLILAINNISMNQERAIERVNNAIDRLMDNHFHISRQDSLYDEDRIEREEKKDPQPTQILQRILSEIRGFSKD